MTEPTLAEQIAAVRRTLHWWTHGLEPKPNEDRHISAIRAALATLEASQTREPESTSYIDIVFDGPPSHIAGRFVEVENEKGASISFGEWVHRDDGYWVLRFLAKRDANGIREGRRQMREEAAKQIKDYGNEFYPAQSTHRSSFMGDYPALDTDEVVRGYCLECQTLLYSDRISESSLTDGSER